MPPPQPAARHPRGRRRSRCRLLLPSPPHSHPCRLPPCRLRVAAGATVDKLQKSETFEFHTFIPRFELFLRVERRLRHARLHSAYAYRSGDSKSLSLKGEKLLHKLLRDESCLLRFSVFSSPE